MNMEIPVDAKAGVKPVFAQLIHSGAYEGPCRVSNRKSLEPEMERKRGKESFG